MTNVVYLLGAGFSAPLGIPVMHDFLDKARKLKRANSKFAYFDNIIKRLQGTVSAGEYFEHDSSNIEEALSLLEMRDNLSGTDTKRQLIDFIADVVMETTPQLPDLRFEQIPKNGWSDIFTKDSEYKYYLGFVASLFNLQFSESTDHGMRGIRANIISSDTSYSIVTLNYDMVLENLVGFLRSQYWWENESLISFSDDSLFQNDNKTCTFVKIHGSVKDRQIIPPTFNKGLYGSELPKSWLLAHKCLEKANKIRVLGYSLPPSDSYIKYLLMSAVDKLKDLDIIDWISLDPNGDVKTRFDRTITFRKKRFCSRNIADYLKAIYNQNIDESKYVGNDKVTFDRLEQAHEYFMK